METAAPEMGQHTEEILAGMPGYSIAKPVWRPEDRAGRTLHGHGREAHSDDDRSSQRQDHVRRTLGATPNGAKLDRRFDHRVGKRPAHALPRGMEVGHGPQGSTHGRGGAEDRGHRDAYEDRGSGNSVARRHGTVARNGN